MWVIPIAIVIVIDVIAATRLQPGDAKSFWKLLTATTAGFLASIFMMGM